MNFLFKHILTFSAICIALYASLLALLTTPTFQSHVVYLHKLQLTWSKDLNTPESFGFLHNHVTPFMLQTPYNSSLYAWHILPLELYRKHEAKLHQEPTGLAEDITSRFAFHILRDDPEARLVVHMHGAAGTIASGYRISNYRALSAGDPSKIHILTFDYQGFGYSAGIPTEEGLIQDAVAVLEWAMLVANIPPSQILIFGQSLGTAVALAVSAHFAKQEPTVVFVGTILVAPFVDVKSLVATYRVAGVIPILSPLARFPFLFAHLQGFIRDQWSSKDRIAEYVKATERNGERWRLTIIHAEDDWDIPWTHSRELFGCAVNATSETGVGREELEEERVEMMVDLGASGTVMEWRTNYGVIREEILKTGLHDAIMGDPAVSMAVVRIFDDLESTA